MHEETNQNVSVSSLGGSPHGLNRVLKEQLAVMMLPRDFDFLPYSLLDCSIY
jgi:hypothetical protein